MSDETKDHALNDLGRSEGKAQGPAHSSLDVDFVRSQFPALKDADETTPAFFENAGGSLPCRQVIERLSAFYHECKVQPGMSYPRARDAQARMDEAQRRLSALLGLDPETHVLVIGPSTTQNAYVLACAFARVLEPGSEIIVTDQDHEANSGFWRRLASNGVVVREWRMDPQSGLLNPADLDDLLSGKTRFVAFPHCSNIIGHFNDVTDIIRRIHAAGALAIVDGVSAAPHGLPDLSAIDADVYFFSTYKTYGPHQGVMAIRRHLVERLPNEGHWFNEHVPEKRLAPAGPDHAQVAALAGIVDYIEALAAHHGIDFHADPAGANARVRDLMRRQEHHLLESLMDFLKQTTREGRVRILGPDRADCRRAPTIALDTNRPPAEIAADLAELGIEAGAGDFYAVRTLSRLSVNPQRGVLRLSFLHYTTETEIDRLIAALDTVL